MNLLWIDFVNSDWRDPLGREQREDRLQSPEWLRRFLDRWKLGRINVRNPESLPALRDLRGLLQRLVRTLVDGRAPRKVDLDALNGYMEAQPVVSRVTAQDDAFRVQLTPTAKGVDAVLFAITASFAEFLVEGDPSRLKTCENDDCRWVFYDTTRSRTRRWCADSCGSLIKVRRFRQRRRKRGNG